MHSGRVLTAPYRSHSLQARLCSGARGLLDLPSLKQQTQFEVLHVPGCLRHGLSALAARPRADSNSQHFSRVSKHHMKIRGDTRNHVYRIVVLNVVFGVLLYSRV